MRGVIIIRHGITAGKILIPALVFLLVASACGNRNEPDAGKKTRDIAAVPSGKPLIQKHGTIDCDMVEVSPVVFKGKLYRFEYVRKDKYEFNITGDSYFRFIDIGTGEVSPGFAAGYHLGSAYVEADTVFVFGTSDWGGTEVRVFRSTDLETWQSYTAWEHPDWTLYNTAVCKTDAGYVMAVEVGAPPEVVGVRFTMRYLTSPDLRQWTLLGDECVYTKDRYSACPVLHFLDGFVYMIYLERKPVPEGIEEQWHAYAPHIIRSKDLAVWEDSPLNPVMSHSSEDKRIANPKLSPEQRDRIASALNLNNSDVDLCEYGGKTIIYYSWGNQHGTEFLAEAEYEGTLAEFIRGFFP